MTSDFTDKKILVVGGSSGIGRQVVEDLLSAGAEVWVWARRDMDDLAAKGAEVAQIDVTASFAEDAPELPESLDGLVYAPGSIELAPFQKLSPETFRSEYELNVVGAVRVLQYALGSLTAGEGSSVVLFSTVATARGMNFHASIAAAKSGVEGLALSLAAELAPKKVRFNVVAPSLTDTPLAEKLLSSDKRREASAERHPLKRVGETRDIAAAVLYLLSPGSSWVTGQRIGVDGGLSMLSG
ncbi:MAG: SDR family NAD(P)-dependent oxidoreductase, partial [Alkalispirochaetaceae bacterium]